MTNGRRGSAPSPASAGDPLSTRKRAIRRDAKARRAAAHARLGASAGALLRQRFAEAVDIPAGAAVAGYAPIRDEIDVMPLLHLLAERGHPCALPVVAAPDAPLLFRAWTPEAVLTDGVFDVPIPEAAAPEIRPAVVLVPLLAFDAAGRRVGYGAGFYDRTLAALRADGGVLAVGVAYADQQVDAVPADGYDQRLDLIATERSVIRPRG